MYSAVITAAGSGSRAGLGYNKMLYVLDGMTVLERTVKTFCDNPHFNQIIVTASNDDYEQYTSILNKYDVELIIGGSERMHSVAAGVDKANNKFVFVHDGARVYLDDSLINRLIEFEDNYDGLALALPVVDTTLMVIDGKIEQILDRDTLFNMQTPQVVNKIVYQTCYKQASSDNLLFTDEMSMLCNYGYNCKVVGSEAYNIKLTRPEDFEE